jgi:type VI secretion system secreted protein Hcp
VAVDILLKIDGVEGESMISGHEGEIDVLSWNWGMSQAGTMHSGGGAGAGKVNIQDISFTKHIDKSSPNLMRACCNGEHFPEAELLVRKAGKEPLDYYKVTMSPVLVTAVTTGGDGGDGRPEESVSLNFAKMTVGYTPQKEDGSGDAQIELKWNIEQNIEE